MLYYTISISATLHTISVSFTNEINMLQKTHYRLTMKFIRNSWSMKAYHLIT